MSLNGLDAPAVQEAYHTAVAESGGWFLLKYTTRDSVELFERGRGGVNEARAAVARYDHDSPLYGLLIYRRRKVLIKYLPEGTSRLLQARTAVHFQDVLERYSPYETLLEFKTSEGLNDTALASVFTLHTASPAVSSNRLNEISEDAEDGASALTVPSSQTTGPPRPGRERRTDRAVRAERPKGTQRPSNSPPPAIQVNGETSPAAPSLASPKSTISQFLVREESGQRSISSLGTPSIASVTEYAGSDRSDTNTEPESAPPSNVELAELTSPPTISPAVTHDVRSIAQPLPTERSRTEARLSTEFTTLDGAPPRHTVVPETRKPTAHREAPPRPGEPPSSAQALGERYDAVRRSSTDKPSDDDPYDLKKYDYLFKPKPKLGPRPVPQDNKRVRPSAPSVAAIPSNVKPQPPKKNASPRPKSQGAAMLAAPQLPVLPAPPPIPDIPEYNPRPLSRGSIKSLPSHKSTNITPDKLRLMKAIELRKKQMRKSQGAELIGTPKFDNDAPEVPTIPTEPPQKQTSLRPHTDADSTPRLDADEAPSQKADSGIEMDYPRAEKREDKQTLELLESPRKETFAPMGRSERAGQPVRSPTTSQVSSELTPKAEPLLPSAIQDDVQLDPSRSDVSPGGTRIEGDLSGTREPAELSPMVGSASPQGVEPSLDENQIFGDDPTRGPSEQTAMLEAPQNTIRRQNSDLAKRRRGYIEPIRLEDMSSDDEIVEELRGAVVHEAKPVTVAKSPITESFIRRPSYPHSGHSDDERAVGAFRRTVSSETRHEEAVEHPSPELRDYSTFVERQDSGSGSRRNVSSGISRRIQELAGHSSRDTSLNEHHAYIQTLSTEGSPSAILPSDRGTNGRGPLRPSRSRTSSFQKTARLSARVSAAQQQHLSGSMYQNENAPILNVHRDPTTNRDSVSVTARIVRPSTNVEATPPAEELQPSSYMFNNDRAVTPVTTDQLTRLDTTTPPAASAYEPVASMFPEVKPPSADQPTRPMHSTTRNHYGRHKQSTPTPATPLSPHPDDFPAPPAASAGQDHSSTSLASPNDEHAAPKEGTRTSRFFKRMSHMATKRRSGAQGSVASESTNSASDRASVKAPGATASRDGAGSADMPPAVVVGNLNVQFPDSLLWKRRILSIDDAGALSFAIPQAMEHQRSSTKKFPLSDFRPPYIPDLDRQELPFSVMLDFVDGGTTLQVACEDTLTHRQVVHALKSYWKAWSG